jgi:hypothetical protein
VIRGIAHAKLFARWHQWLRWRRARSDREDFLGGMGLNSAWPRRAGKLSVPRLRNYDASPTQRDDALPNAWQPRLCRIGDEHGVHVQMSVADRYRERTLVKRAQAFVTMPQRPSHPPALIDACRYLTPELSCERVN